MARKGAAGTERIVGIVLVAVGAVLLATRMASVADAPAWLLGLGLAGALIAILKRSYGLLLAGLLVVAVGAGMVLGDAAVGGLSIRFWRLATIGAAFVLQFAVAAILGIGRRPWPLLVGLVVLAVAAAPFLRELAFVPPSVEAFVRTWWPAALVLGGAVLLFRGLKK